MIMIAQGNFEQVDPLVVKPIWHTRSLQLDPVFGARLVLETSFFRMHVLLTVNPWRVHLPCQLARRQKHDSRSFLQTIIALCPLW